jgi:hypothetical protein
MKVKSLCEFVLPLPWLTCLISCESFSTPKAAPAIKATTVNKKILVVIWQIDFAGYLHEDLGDYTVVVVLVGREINRDN